MRANSRTRLFGCTLATPANRWRCVELWLGWMLAILLWTVFVAKAKAEAAPGPGSGPVSGSVQSLALRVMESDETCSEVRLILAQKVKAVRDTTDATDDDDTSPSSHPQQLGVCSQDSVCCTGQMESLLVRQSETEMKKMISDKMKTIKQTFITWTAKFDSFFQGLIERSKRSLYDLFNRSYGAFFEHNAHIFIQLYSDLRSHYRSDEINLEDVLDRFFTALLQRMFSLLNDDLELTDEYLQCVAEHMDLLRPFNDIPQRLLSEIRRSFLVARAFVQGLSQGKEIVLIMAKQSPDDECSKKMARMLFCQFCQGHSAARPCFDFCLTTVSQCLSQSIELQDEWTNYLRELFRLADRLSDPFNIESVVSLLDDKISEAIMNYQENSINVTTLVRQNCGNPPSKSRQRRELRLDNSTETPPESIPSSSSSPSSSFPTSPSSFPSSTSSSSSSSSSSDPLSTSSSSSSISFSDSSTSSLNSSSSSSSQTTRAKSRQRQQQRKQQRQRQQQEEQQREGQPEQQEGEQEDQTQQPEQQEEQSSQQQEGEPSRGPNQQQQQREEQPGQSREQRRQQRQRERLQQEQQRQQQEEIARQQQLYDEQQRQTLLNQTQESDQYTEQPPDEQQGQQRQPLLSQPRESDQYIEQPPVEQQRQRQRLQQRQPAESQQNREQRVSGQPRQRQQPKQQHRQQRPSSPEVTLTELERNLKDVGRKLEAVRTFWDGLPLSICGDVIAEPSNETTCWNGVDLSRREGVAEDSGYTRRPVQLTSVIRQQILKLKVTADKLRQAYNGWTENDLDGSGNGMDFGSGIEVETAPPPFEEIRTNAPEVATNTDNRATKTSRRLTSGSFRPNSDTIFVPILLSLYIIGLHWFSSFFDAFCR